MVLGLQYYNMVLGLQYYNMVLGLQYFITWYWDCNIITWYWDCNIITCHWDCNIITWCWDCNWLNNVQWHWLRILHCFSCSIAIVFPFVLYGGPAHWLPFFLFFFFNDPVLLFLTSNIDSCQIATSSFYFYIFIDYSICYININSLTACCIPYLLASYT